MGEVRKVGNLAFLAKKGLLGVKWPSIGSTKCHKSTKVVSVFGSLRVQARSCKPPHAHSRTERVASVMSGSGTGRFQCFCTHRQRVFFAVKKGPWRNP